MMSLALGWSYFCTCLQCWSENFFGIFGKVHGHAVKKIWLISQFPAKHTGVASGAKIVFAWSGLARLLGYGYGLINDEFISNPSVTF